MPQAEIDVVLFDRYGGLWLAPAGHGISRWLGYGNWEGFTKQDGLGSEVIWALPRDQFGDLAIRECADRIAGTIRPVDLVGRYGGEELLILMPGLDPASSIARMEELRMAIAGEPIRRGPIALQVTCSFGVAWMGDRRCALESLVGMADEALYLAKNNGRNRVEFARELTGLISLLSNPATACKALVNLHIARSGFPGQTHQDMH